MPAPATSPLPGAAAQRASHALHWEEQEDASTPAAFMQDNAQFERQTRQIFDRLDRDGDGGLDREELLYRMKELGVPTSPAALDRWFELSDRDHSASVSFEEFLQFRLGRRDQIRSLWDRMRGSDKGLTSAAMMVGLRELGIKAADEEIRQQVSMLDSSGDGVISFADFCSWLVLLPDVNPRAVFDDFARIGYHDDAHGEYTVPRPQPSGMTASAIATKLLCGGIAGMVSRTATAPVDRLKIMCQAAPAGGTPPGLSALVRTVFAEGGVRAFFRGNGANCVKIAPETGVKFVAFDLLKGAIAADPHNVTVTERFAAGGLAGASAQCAIYPLEIAKTRLALASPGTYGGLASCLRTVQGTEGVRALYAGLGTSIVGIIPYAAIDLACNSILKELVCKRLDSSSSSGTAAATGGAGGGGGGGGGGGATPREPSIAVLLGCGVSSSTVAMLATYPINLIRTRLQAAGLPANQGTAAAYAGPMDVVRQTAKADGLRGFYRGLLPNMLKVLPATGISYSVFSVVSARVGQG